MCWCRQTGWLGIQMCWCRPAGWLMQFFVSQPQRQQNQNPAPPGAHRSCPLAPAQTLGIFGFWEGAKGVAPFHLPQLKPSEAFLLLYLLSEAGFRDTNLCLINSLAWGRSLSTWCKYLLPIYKSLFWSRNQPLGRTNCVLEYADFNWSDITQEVLRGWGWLCMSELGCKVTGLPIQGAVDWMARERQYADGLTGKAQLIWAAEEKMGGSKCKCSLVVRKIQNAPYRRGFFRAFWMGSFWMRTCPLTQSISAFLVFYINQWRKSAWVVNKKHRN